jgi:6-pyruvoyltetrahydropterin/6-carboxytetrahydropterin synthase
MSIIRVTKKFHFEMAHSLFEYDGVCRNIHGHSYKLEITISGEPLQQPGHPKDGMVMDFHELKMLVKQHIIEKLDHALMISDQTSREQTEALGKVTNRLYIVGFQPTTENILTHIAEILKPLLPKSVKLYSIRLYETTTSYAEWFAADNL